MNTIDSSRLLAEMSRMAQAASGLPVGLENNSISESHSVSQKGNFGDILSNALGTVNELQMQAGALSDSFIKGESGVSLAATMIAGQKASVAFEATLQVRNRLVQAYQDIMNMPV